MARAQSPDYDPLLDEDSDEYAAMMAEAADMPTPTLTPEERACNDRWRKEWLEPEMRTKEEHILRIFAENKKHGIPWPDHL